MAETGRLRLPSAVQVREAVRNARNGDPEALGLLLNLFRPYLLLSANKHLHPLVKPKMSGSDLVQQTLMEAQVGFARFVDSDRTHVRRWLHTLLLNNIADAHDRYLAADKRKVSRERPIGGSEAQRYLAQCVPANGPSPSDALGKREAWERVQGALAQLSPDHRQVIQQRDFERLEYIAIAEAMGRSEKAVRMLHLRALARLATLFDGESP